MTNAAWLCRTPRGSSKTVAYIITRLLLPLEPGVYVGDGVVQGENVYLQEEIKTEHNLEAIIGQSLPLKRVLQSVEQVAPADITVLIYGETGTGKELIARAIHDLSPRKDRPLIKVNCGAMSAGLIEIELDESILGRSAGSETAASGRHGARLHPSRP